MEMMAPLHVGVEMGVMKQEGLLEKLPVSPCGYCGYCGYYEY